MLVSKTYLQTLLALSEAAYDVSKLPAGFSTPRLITADPKASPDAKLDAQELCFGYATTDAAGMTYICFRGTQNVEEWADDGCALLVPFKVGNVHKGFHDVYTSLRASAAAAFGYIGPFTVVGHSLGAALATLCALDLAMTPFMAQKVSVNLVTFAGPRVGDEQFANWVEGMTGTHLRVVNSRDIVPHLPCRPQFSHAGGTVTFAGQSLDWKVAHSEPLTYVPAIDGMADAIETAVNLR